MHSFVSAFIEPVPFGSRLTLVASSVVLLAASACTGDSGDGNPFEPGPVHPCSEATNCELDGAVSSCAPGTVWENPADKDNFNCVAVPGKLGNFRVPAGGRDNLGFNGIAGVGGPIGSDSWSLFDLNGDGLNDLVITARVQPDGNNSSVVSSFGLADSSPYWFVHFNTGRGFAETGTRFSLPEGGRDATGFHALAGSGGPIGSDAWSTFDINGDRLPDLIITGRVQPDGNNSSRQLGFGLADDAPYWFVHLNTGLGFTPTGVRWSLPPSGGHAETGFDGISGTGGPLGSDQYSLVDVTGDALPDLVITSRIQPDGNSTQNRGFGLADNAPFWVVYPNTGSGFALE